MSDNNRRGKVRDLPNNIFSYVGRQSRNLRNNQSTQNPYLSMLNSMMEPSQPQPYNPYDNMSTATNYEQQLQNIYGNNTAQTDQLTQLANIYGASAQTQLQELQHIAATSQQESQAQLQNLIQQAYSDGNYPTTAQTFQNQSFYPTPQSSTAPAPTTFSSSAPPPPPGPQVPTPPQPANTLLSQETFKHIQTRPSSARARLGSIAVLEARKGLSRILDATSQQDIEHFGQQLRDSDQIAVELDWQNDDRLPVFAVSYVQHNPPTGRFKFDNEQWECFVLIVQELAKSGVTKFRIWLDQCLWLRDASQGGWAHTGLLPYVMWPVICLGKKKVGGEKSVETAERMWPFLEEVAGLWGMGVIFAREMRNADRTLGWRRWMSYSHRCRLEPEQGMELLLINIFHGAADDLKTGWQDDVTELKDMARANVLLNGNELFIGSDWKERIASANVHVKSGYRAIQDLALPIQATYLGGVNVYLDGSRTVMTRSWNGIREWLSGCDDIAVERHDFSLLGTQMKKIQVMSDVGEFQMLRIGAVNRAIWLLVAMDGVTSNFSRGKVAWTKVMTGLGSCQLMDGVVTTSPNAVVVGQVLSAELQRRVHIVSAKLIFEAIEWE